MYRNSCKSIYFCYFDSPYFAQICSYNLNFGRPNWLRYFLFLNVEFTDSPSRMPRTVEKRTKRFIQIKNLFTFRSTILDQKFLSTKNIIKNLFSISILVRHIETAFIHLVIYFVTYFQFRFVISIFKNP